jgi:fructosamine-3-kinase
MTVSTEHSEFFKWVSQNLGEKELPIRRSSATGGCIHDSQVWAYENGNHYFIKCNQEAKLPVLLAEKNALAALHASRTVRVPRLVFCGSYAGKAVLALEYLELLGLDRSSGRRLGEQLAAMHGHTREHFGFDGDNFIGANEQRNSWENCWAAFFITHRIGFQFKMAEKRGFELGSLLKLEKAVEHALEHHIPSPSLLHGDLWGGNAGSLADGTPVIFDPATYFGDRETDIAFTEVFGGFSREFYDAYCSCLDDWDESGFRRRKTIYNLYHYLNHLNLFGASYLGACERSIKEIIKSHG